ncbi:MAG: hypothetical protein MJ191_07525 [Clostridium sp.]|nr:hypothetical protein [Clostridium sp.]
MINLGMKCRLLWKSFTNPSILQKRAEEVAETAEVVEQVSRIKVVIQESNLSQDTIVKALDTKVPVSEVLTTLTADVSLF